MVGCLTLPSRPQIYADPTKRLELHFRPKDPYCHPVCANRLSATNLLLRVRKRTRRRPGVPPEVTLHMEVVGIVPIVYKFQGASCSPRAPCGSRLRQPRWPEGQDTWPLSIGVEPLGVGAGLAVSGRSR